MKHATKTLTPLELYFNEFVSNGKSDIDIDDTLKKLVKNLIFAIQPLADATKITESTLITSKTLLNPTTSVELRLPHTDQYKLELLLEAANRHTALSAEFKVDISILKEPNYQHDDCGNLVVQEEGEILAKINLSESTKKACAKEISKLLASKAKPLINFLNQELIISELNEENETRCEELNKYRRIVKELEEILKLTYDLPNYFGLFE
jgi:hypothetical protein